MKIIESGKFITSMIRCPYCKALLEIDKRDIRYFMSRDNTYIKCEECESVIFVNKNGEKFEVDEECNEKED